LIFCRSAVLAAALTCSVTCSVTCSAFAAPISRASSAPAAPSTLLIQNAAQNATTDSEASQAAPAGAVPTSSSTRHYHRRHVSRHASARSLPSRGGSSGEAASSVVGRLALVTSDKAVITAGREAAGRVLSICPKGQYLALSGQTPTQYAVLMIDHSLGFVAKSDVQLLEYQVVNNAPDAGGDTPSAAGGSLGQSLVQTAQGYLGVPYVWGGTTASGIDCSGFVRAVYAAHGISLPRVSGDQATVGYDVPRIDWSQWVPGDRMYFACHHPRIDHTAMYIGGGYFIHASMGHGQAVAIDRVDGAYYAAHLVCVRRSRELVGDAPVAAPPVSDAGQSTAAVDDPEAGQR
jgi:cell wall-associated NlpC family hydrolase